MKTYKFTICIILFSIWLVVTLFGYLNSSGWLEYLHLGGFYNWARYFWKQFPYFTLGHVLTGVVMPLSIFFIAKWRDDRKDFRKSIYIRNGFLADLTKMFTQLSFDIKLLELNLRFAEDLSIENMGGCVPSYET